MKIEIKCRFTDKVLVSGEYESIKECLVKNRGADLMGANLEGADLRGAKLRGAYLSGAYLMGAKLRGAYLRGAYLMGTKEYKNSHYFFEEIVRRQKIDMFTEKEWSAIAQIRIHLLCWDAIKKRFAKPAMSIFKKLAKIGFTEWLDYFKETQE